MLIKNGVNGEYLFHQKTNYDVFHHTIDIWIWFKITFDIIEDKIDKKASNFIQNEVPDWPINITFCQNVM